MYLTVFIFVIASVCAQRETEKMLRVSNGGQWGTWRDTHFCPEGAFADGFRQKFMNPRGVRDDTATNGIQLSCSYSFDGNSFAGQISSGMGDYGSWTSWKYCPPANKFLTSVKLRVEKRQGFGDDTSLNGASFGCRSSESEDEFAVEGKIDHLGKWGDLSERVYCPAGTAICGLKTRLETPGTGRGDCTALNDAQFYCCPLTPFP